MCELRYEIYNTALKRKTHFKINNFIKALEVYTIFVKCCTYLLNVPYFIVRTNNVLYIFGYTILYQMMTC